MLFWGVWQSWVLDLELQDSGQVLWFWKGSDLSLGPALLFINYQDYLL